MNISSIPTLPNWKPLEHLVKLTALNAWGNIITPTHMESVARLPELKDFGNGVPVMPLLEGSPAIDAGIATENTPKTDITDRPRNVGKAPDIGAFEWR